VKAKLGAALVCLAFAIPFGGVGAGASWVLARMIQDGHRAEDWVRVKAEVDSFGNGSVNYHYTFAGRSYSGDRLGANPIGGTDNVDSWHDDMSAMLSEAKSAGKPITVWVNPDNPSESMVDRTIRWKLAVFIIPFALGFGGVGLGAIVVFLRTLLRSSKEVERDPIGTPSGKAGGVFMMWAFAFFWNAISAPIALLVVPEAVESGQWAMLFVLIFPLIGVLLVWGAVGSTITAIKGAFNREPAMRAAPAPSQPANDGVFARGMLKDAPSDAIDTTDAGLPAAPDPAIGELERISGKKLDAAQREQLEKLSPKQRKMIARMAGWAEKMKTD
jgi:hypothetical protein